MYHINSKLFLFIALFIISTISKLTVSLNMYSSYSISNDTPESITTKLTTLRNSFRENKTKSYKWRIEQLKQLKKLLIENEKDLADALFKDLGRPNFEAVATDLVPLIVEIDFAISNLHKWMKSTPTMVPAALLPATSEYIYEPFGVCLIIGAFNFPLYITLSPLIGMLILYSILYFVYYSCIHLVYYCFFMIIPITYAYTIRYIIPYT